MTTRLCHTAIVKVIIYLDVIFHLQHTLPSLSILSIFASLFQTLKTTSNTRKLCQFKSYFGQSIRNPTTDMNNHITTIITIDHKSAKDGMISHHNDSANRKNYVAVDVVETMNLLLATISLGYFIGTIVKSITM